MLLKIAEYEGLQPRRITSQAQHRYEFSVIFLFKFVLNNFVMLWMKCNFGAP